MFHHTFLTIMKGLDPLETNATEECDHSLMPKTAESIIKMAPFMLQGVKRKQVLKEATEDYYVARDLDTGVVYICYRDLLMMDIDNKNDSPADAVLFTDELILNHFSKLDNMCFRIFKSKNGYHVFCVSQPYHYRSIETMEMMLTNHSDFYYCVYCYIRGFSVRLTRKFNERKGVPIYTELGTVGDLSLQDSRLSNLVDKHLTLMSKYKEYMSVT